MRIAAKLAVVLVVAAACGPKPAPPPVDRVTTLGNEPNGAPPAPGAPVQKARAIETPALVAKPLPDDPVKATIHRLSNGMTVYIATDRQEPTVVAHIAVRAGSRHDQIN